MKKIFILLGLTVLVLTGCRRDYDPLPVADFSVDFSYIEPDEVVAFYNSSLHANSYRWDFGDGTYTNEIAPTHFYDREGTYQVELIAYGPGGESRYYMSIEVYYTTLEVVVQEYKTDDYVSGIEVSLYDNYNDWYGFNNPIVSGFTDNYGSVMFYPLDDISYYIDAYAKNFDNQLLGDDDIDFVRTAPLEYAMHNVFIAYVEYVTPLKSAGDDLVERKRTLAVKGIKKVVGDRKLQWVKPRK